MYYEPYRPRRRPSCLGRLFRVALILLIVWGALMLISSLPVKVTLPFGAGEFSLNRLFSSGYTHILLLGADNEEGRGRTDSILVATIGGGEIKLTSIMRDTLVDMGDYGRHKINAAYRLGGEDLAMRTVNQAFGLDISRYAVIDFEGFSHVIDSIGGVQVDVTKAEMQEINKGVKATWKRLGDGTDDIAYLKTYGKDTLLTGPQALAFSRIRKIDSDYMRAGRQRAVLEALIGKLRETHNPVALARLAQAVLSNVKTNVNVMEIGYLGTKVLMGSQQMLQLRLPADGAYTTGTEEGAWVIKPDLGKNRKLLNEFLYGQ